MPFPVAAVAIPAATSLISSAWDWFRSNEQEERADELERRNIRPDFEIPGSATKSLQSAENQAKLTRLPGQGAIEGRLDRVTADKIATVERMGVGGPTSINAASRAYGQQMDAENELGIKAAEFQVRNQDILRNELGKMAGWEKMKWDWDKGQPYLSNAEAIANLREASIRNENTAFKNLVGGFGNSAMMAWWGSQGGASPQTSPTDMPSDFKTDVWTSSPVFSGSFGSVTPPAGQAVSTPTSPVDLRKPTSGNPFENPQDDPWWSQPQQPNPRRNMIEQFQIRGY